MNARKAKSTTKSTLRTILEGASDLQLRCTSHKDESGKHHWLHLGIWTDEEGGRNIAADAYEIAALVQFGMVRGEEFTFRGLGNNDTAVDFTADLQSGDAAEKRWVNAALSSVLTSSKTVEDVLAQTHSLAPTLLRKSWTPAFGEECSVDFVPGKELNWERIDPALEVTVPQGTPAHKRTALVFATAMKVQRAMPAGQRCVVHASIMKDRAFVTIQLVTNEAPEATDADEMARIMSVLDQVASGR